MILKNSWYRIGRFLVRLFARSIFDLSIEWKAPIPHGPVILAANHPSTVDPALITTLTQDHVSILIRETLFKVPLLGRSLSACGHIPVIQGSGQAAFAQAQALLEAGQTVAVFPEGEISPVDGYHPPHTGLVRLALATGAPIVPVGIHLDPMQIREIKTRVDHQIEIGTWYFHGSYAMTVGKAIRLTGDVEDRVFVRRVSESVMAQVILLAKESAQRIELIHRLNWLGMTRWWLWSPVRLVRTWGAFADVDAK